ncbi:PepSY domain-containing protein [Methylobacterium organophilum]|uniref:PepSY-associated TM helix domain-containing protein n=1 Tax=Methylobacterium organophilum TaxID=410 RepID=UPI001F137611|nr:PepSY-associated TM helix domain-containing protein [Methylobacterium organophilum]UMY16865.1 PepSY domain-containing protein [Methylobacterium organophilum]
MTAFPRLRSVLFRLHWALGLTAGLVLALMGITGALLSYEEAIGDLVDADLALVRVEEGRGRLTPEALVARAQAERPGARVEALTLSGDPAEAPRLRFARGRDGARPASLYLDPYDGAVRGEARTEAAFATIRALHRWLLLPGDGRGWGRTLTGFCALSLLVFLGTGLYLRWPKLHRWRIWLKPSLSRPGRARWWSLHAVLGTWLVPVYAVIALSGLWWSYDWYRTGATLLLTGASPAAKAERKRGAGGPLALDKAWAAFMAGPGREARLSVIALPGPEAEAIRIRFLTATGGQGQKDRDEARFSAETGALLAVQPAADKPLGRQIAENMLEVHRGRFFGAPVALLFCLAALMMPLFAGTGLTLYWLRRAAARRRAPPATQPAYAAAGGS